MGTYTLALGIATFASTIIGPYVANWVGKKNTYIFAGIYGVAGYLVLRLFGASNPVVFTAIVCIATLGAGLSAPLRHAMYMDTAEYGYFKSGKDASAFVVSMFTLPVKIGIFLATTVATYGLHLIGFDVNMVVTDQFIGRLMDLICYIPAACCVIAFAVMAFYKLTEENIAIYMEANTKKRAEEQAE
jgi:GPH family glycoside/pentoside/hexuronide:cation symporter